MIDYKVINCVESGGWVVVETLGGTWDEKVSGPFVSRNEAEKRKKDLIKCRQVSSAVKRLTENCDYAAPVKPGFSDSVVVPIKPSADAAQALRNIADRIESGELPNEATVVCGPEVFHAGQVDDARAATDAVFNLTVGIHRLMRPVMEGVD
tara:strand:- start:14 stop:466 length:453 start_codon:yes stop_codon:yes gene_type:complete